MPATPPLRTCVDCGRPLWHSWREYLRCRPGSGCRKGEGTATDAGNSAPAGPAGPASAQLGAGAPWPAGF